MKTDANVALSPAEPCRGPARAYPEASRARVQANWYTLFGITKRDAANNKESAHCKCVDRAYRDFSRTLDFFITNSKIDGEELDDLAEKLEAIIDRYGPKGKDKLTKTDIKNSFSAFKEDFRRGNLSMEESNQSAGKFLAGEITRILENERQDFETWHTNTCGELIKRSKSFECGGIPLFAQRDGEVAGMSYGQAQKWVNMSLKYMLIMDLWNMSDIIPEMHIPIDNTILGAACEQLGNPEGEHLIKHLSNGEYQLTFCGKQFKWSQIPGKNEYAEVQRILNSCATERGMAPMDVSAISSLMLNKTTLKHRHDITV